MPSYVIVIAKQDMPAAGHQMRTGRAEDRQGSWEDVRTSLMKTLMWAVNPVDLMTRPQAQLILLPLQ